jgi:hypothetical protein
VNDRIESANMGRHYEFMKYDGEAFRTVASKRNLVQKQDRQHRQTELRIAKWGGMRREEKRVRQD